MVALFNFVLAARAAVNSTPPADVKEIRYHSQWSDPSFDMNIGACSDGANGLAYKWPTLGHVPSWPYVGGLFAVKGWNSPACGTCWNLTSTSTGNTVFITAIDASYPVDVSQATLDALTNNQAVGLGANTAEVMQVDKSLCGQ